MTASSLAQLADGRVDPQLLREITREVVKVEEELANQMGSRVDIVHQVNDHTLKAGGKRLRPAFVTLAARSTGNAFDSTRTLRLGACLEMIHMATLLHDDVIDESSTRRGRPTACAAYGNTAAILSGDVLLAKAMLLLAQDGDLEVIRTVSEAVMELDMTGAPVVVFRHASHGRINLVYRRPDGNVGWIDPPAHDSAKPTTVRGEDHAPA